MAVIKRLSSNGPLEKIIKYVKDYEKTDDKIISGKDCTPDSALNKMKCTKKVFNKTDKRQYHHIIQSFKPGEVKKEVAHEIGVKLAENNFKDYEVLIATHTDKEHIHNHLIVNSVSFVHGEKYKDTRKCFLDLKKESDEICKEYGLSIIEKATLRARDTMTEKQLRHKGIQPWKDDLRDCINIAIKNTNNVYELSEYLEVHFGIETKIQKKNLSFKHPEKEKFCRGEKLGTAWTRENIEKSLINKKKILTEYKDSRFNNLKSGIREIGSGIAWSITKEKFLKKKEQEEERERDEKGHRGGYEK